MAIYITGDTHGDFQRFGSKYFPQQKEMSREDYLPNFLYRKRREKDILFRLHLLTEESRLQ